MKKILLSVVAASVFSFGLVKADRIISIDSVSIMQKSKEGIALSEDIKNKITSYQDLLQNFQKKISSLEKEITDKKDVLSKDALEKKKKYILEKKKEMGATISQKEISLRTEIQKKQIALRDKHLVIANKMCKKENWNILIDRNTPGVLFTSKAIDKTDLILKAVNDDYASSSLKKGDKKAV